MHRSPNPFLAAVFLLASAVSGWSQSNPATPKPGSGVPQTPITTPNTAPPQTPAPPASATVPDTTPPATPTATPATNAQPGQVQGDQKKAADQQKASTGKTGTEKTKTEGTSTDKNGAAEPAPTATPIPQANPKTDILDSSATSGALVTDGHDPILDAAPMPRTTTTLVGGTITKVDRMRNRMTVHIFGGSHWTVNFDERTHIFHNVAETTQLALKKGERV